MGELTRGPLRCGKGRAVERLGQNGEGGREGRGKMGE